MSPEGQTAGVHREARRQWKITEMPPVNAQSLGLIELGFLRVDSANRNQILSKIRSRSGPDRCIWHANRDKSNLCTSRVHIKSMSLFHLIPPTIILNFCFILNKLSSLSPHPSFSHSALSLSLTLPPETSPLFSTLSASLPPVAVPPEHSSTAGRRCPPSFSVVATSR